MVIKTVPKDKLLIMDIKDGWEPLCKFLGKPVPDKPFPRGNETAVLNAMGQKILLQLLLIWLGIIGAFGGTCYALYHGLQIYMEAS
jgi:hypothetical protein